MQVECSVCGGAGFGDMRASAAQWIGAAQHTDPRVCAAHLALERERLEEERKSLVDRRRTPFEEMDVQSEQAKLDDLGRRIKDLQVAHGF